MYFYRISIILLYTPCLIFGSDKLSTQFSPLPRLQEEEHEGSEDRTDSKRTSPSVFVINLDDLPGNPDTTNQTIPPKTILIGNTVINNREEAYLACVCCTCFLVAGIVSCARAVSACVTQATERIFCCPCIKKDPNDDDDDDDN